MRKLCIVGLPVIALLTLAACGGGGGSTVGGGGTGGSGGTGTGTGGGGSSAPPSSGIPYTAGVYPSSSTFAQQCEVPRTGMCPWGAACPDKQGSALTEKNFLRSWTNELYLWFSEVADTNPAAAAGSVEDYFNLLKTNAVTASGKDKDHFHFTYNTADYYALSQSGSSVSYGIVWAVVNPYPPRELRVQEVQVGTAAATAGIRRGDLLISVDGINAVNDNTQQGVDALNAALFNPVSGSIHNFSIGDRDNASSVINTAFAATQVSFSSVPLVKVIPTATGNVGYMLFDDHTAVSEGQLAAGIQQLATAGVGDLVLDLRYNGGGYLDVASELAYMIAGPNATAGKIFETEQFNSQYTTTDPVTGETIEPVPFHSTAQGFSVTDGTALPWLGLSRVYVLTSNDTCSASEAVINGLRGIGVDVYQIGSDTCGKPYGFYPQDNCGTTYFSIEFRGINNAGFGDYTDGFSATRVNGDARANLPGCAATDDLLHDLGDATEGQLQVALSYRASANSSASCPAVLMGLAKPQAAAETPREVDDSLAVRPPAEPWRSIRVLR